MPSQIVPNVTIVTNEVAVKDVSLNAQSEELIEIAERIAKHRAS